MTIDSISNFASGFITLIVGLFAFTVYSKSKFDYKKDSANIVLLEIQSAERQIKKIKEALTKNSSDLPDIHILQDESWTKFGYLFLSDFKRDEWDTITSFYNTCKMYDQCVEYNNSFFQKNEQEIRINRQKVITEYVRDYAEKIEKVSKSEEKDKLIKERDKKINAFIDDYMNVNTTNLKVPYSPKKPVTDGNTYMSSVDSNISLMSVGTKLEKIASSKFLSLF
ncbi:MAG TPA: hypothetical protein VFQ63_02150 [Patescibacteria group bacterium]|nr:hypothetical protein [Patescibacteria group bacterium]